MFERIFKIGSILLVLLAIVGCDSVSYKGVDSEIVISISEELPSRELKMHFKTTRIYDVYDNQIKLSWRKTQMGFDVLFQGVLETGMLTAIGPATATINLGALNTGTYQLTLRNEQETFKGQLFVVNDKYTIRLNSNSGFQVQNSPLNRIPDNTIWGLVGYHTEETTPLVQSFFSELIELGVMKKSFAPGDYNRFQIDKDGDIINYNGGYWFNQAFIFYYSEDSSELDKFLKQWSELHGTTMSIRIYTAKGEQFFSWRY